MSASPARSSSRIQHGTTTPPSAASRGTARRVYSPTGTVSTAPSPLNRQLSARASVKGPRSSPRTLQPNEQATHTSSIDRELTQDARETLKTQELELFKLRSMLQESELADAEYKQETQVLKEKIAEMTSENHRLEDDLEIRLQEISELRDELRELQKSKVEYLQLTENEQQRLLEEKHDMIRSNSELSAQLKALRSSLQLERSRETLVSPEDKKSPDILRSASLESISREKDRQIESLRSELADLEFRLAEQVKVAIEGSKKLEDALLQTKLENNRLVETVESYQILLQDRTLKGEYHLMNLGGVREGNDSSSSRANSPSLGEQNQNLTSLASELEEAEEDYNSKIKALQFEIRHLKDSNKAMSLYINEIIGRLLQTQGFEHVLEKDVNKSLPVPPTQAPSHGGNRTFSSRPTTEPPLRRSVVVDNLAHKRMSSEVLSTPSAGLGGGLSRAFSFRKKEAGGPSTNLRPLKLVEEQHPQSLPRVDGTTAHLRSRTYNDDSDPDSMESKAAKRASWVPGWFAKTGTGMGDERSF